MTLTEALTAIRSRLEKATPGPYWTYRGKGVFSKGQEGVSLIDENDETEIESLEMLAHAPDDIAKLLRAVELLRKQRNRHLACYENAQEFVDADDAELAKLFDERESGEL